MALELKTIAQARDMAASGAGRMVREANRLSLSEIGEAVGVSAPTVWRWERGKALPRRDHAERYFAVLRELARP